LVFFLLISVACLRKPSFILNWNMLGTQNLNGFVIVGNKNVKWCFSSVICWFFVSRLFFSFGCLIVWVCLCWWVLFFACFVLLYWILFSCMHVCFGCQMLMMNKLRWIEEIGYFSHCYTSIGLMWLVENWVEYRKLISLFEFDSHICDVMLDFFYKMQ
jgi:hypothetical protein